MNMQKIKKLWLDPTLVKAFKRILLKQRKYKEDLSIMDFEELGALDYKGCIKPRYKELFDRFEIDYSAFL